MHVAWTKTAAPPFATDLDARPGALYVGEARLDDEEYEAAFDATTARVARRCAMTLDPSKRDMTFVVGGTITSERVRDVLRANGVEAIEIAFVADPWPHVVLWTGTTLGGDIRGTLTFQVEFNDDTVGLTATIKAEPWDDLADDDDGMPPIDE
jgi:hypothetical protein